MAQAPALPGGFELPLEPRLPRIGSVDAVALEARAGELAKRSIKKGSKLAALDLVVRMIDLTTLEGADTPGKVAALCSKAIRPDPTDPTIPSVAAVCVYPNLVAVARERVGGTGVKVASVATAFPSGQSPLGVKLADVRDAVDLGADEIDMVIDRGAFLSGRYAKVYDEIVRVKEACGEAHLKVILETGELGTYEHRSDESGRWIRMEFCPRCGTSIGATFERSPELRSQLAGTFDDPSWIDISRHIWTRSAQHWVPIPEGPPRFEKQAL